MQETNSSPKAEPVNRQPAVKNLDPSKPGSGHDDLRCPMPRRALQIFTCFPNLAKELRDLIWKEACFIPRDIPLWREAEDLGPFKIFEEDDLSLYHCEYFTPQNYQPAVLHTNRESRTIALRHYTLEFGSKTKHQFSPYPTSQSTISCDTPASIYVNWECDTIILMNDSLEPVMQMLDIDLEYRNVRAFTDTISASSIRQLAIDLMRSPASILQTLPQLLPNLQYLILYCCHDQDYQKQEKFNSLENFRMRLFSVSEIKDHSGLYHPWLDPTIKEEMVDEAKKEFIRLGEFGVCDCVLETFAEKGMIELNNGKKQLTIEIRFMPGWEKDMTRLGTELQGEEGETHGWYLYRESLKQQDGPTSVDNERM